MWQSPLLIVVIGVFLFVTSYQAYVVYQIHQGQKRWRKLLDEMEPIMHKLNVQIVTPPPVVTHDDIVKSVHRATREGLKRFD